MLLIYALGAVIILSLAVQAFFAASEMALISLDYIRLKNRAENEDRRARAVVFFLERPKLLFGTTLLGVNIAIVLNSAVASSLAGLIIAHCRIDIAPQARNLITTAILLPLVLFFGEIVPMGFSRLHPEWFVSAGIRIFRPAYLLMLPAVRITAGISSLVSRLTGAEKDFHASLVTREELESYISNSFGVAEKNYSLNIERIISDAFGFSRTPASEAMIPLTVIEGLPETAAAEEVLTAGGRTGHSRLPVYREEPGMIIGYVQVMDFINDPPGRPALERLRRPLIIPETMPLSKLLPRMIARRERVAFPVNAFGTVTGLLTDEDATEAVFGRIYDEHDRSAENGDASFIPVSGEITIEALNRQFGLGIPDGPGYATLAGYILKRLKRIPRPGTAVELDGVTFMIEDATRRRITRVSVSSPEPEESGNA
ncbi:hemolysin family protein [Planctomycetota bacterium]